MNRFVEGLRYFSQVIDNDFRKPAWRIEEFGLGFDNLVSNLKNAYRVDHDGIYSQEQSDYRFKNALSLNTAKTFLQNMQFNPDIVEKVAQDHSSMDRDRVVVKLGDYSLDKRKITQLNAGEEGYQKSDVVAILAHGAAKLELLLEGGDRGISEVYATAIGQAKKELALIKDAALLAYDWDINWDRLNVKNAISKAKNRVTKGMVRKGMAVGSLALASCMVPADSNGVPTQMPDYITQVAATEQAMPGVEQTPSPDQAERAKTAVYEIIKDEELSKMVADFETKPTQYYDSNGQLLVVDGGESPFTMTAGMRFTLEGGKKIEKGYVTGPGGVGYFASLSKDGKSWDLATALPPLTTDGGSTFYGFGYQRNVITGEYPVSGSANTLGLPTFSREVGPNGELIQDWVIDLNAKDEAEWFKITLPVGASKSAMPVELGGSALLQAQELMKDTEYAETYNTVWMVNPDGTRTLALSTDGTEAGVAFTRDENNTKWLGYPRYTAEQIHTMTPEQLMAVVPDIEGYEKQYQGLYVHYVNELGQLGGSYNLETGDRLTMPENLRTLDKLPTKIENADSYSEVDVKDLPSFVAWMHFRYDDQASGLKPYPFVEKADSDPNGSPKRFDVFFESVSSVDKYTIFPGMILFTEGKVPVLWGYPRIIKDISGETRVQLSSDAWDNTLSDPQVVNGFYTRLTSNPAIRDKWQIAKFADNPEESCSGYNKANGTDYKGCMYYLDTYYPKVESAVKAIISGEFPPNFESVPVFMGEDTKVVSIDN